MTQLITALLLGAATFLSAAPAKPTVERFDLLTAITNGDRATVEQYCAEDRSLDVSRTLSTQDTAVHVAIRALISEYEKQSNTDRMINNLGLWLFSGAATTFIAHSYWPQMWGQLSQANDLVTMTGAGMKNLASLSGNVLLLGTMGGIIGWSLKNIYKNGRGIVRNWIHTKSAQERLKIVELLLAHQSFNPAAASTDGQTPLALIQIERERVAPESALHKVLQTLEAKLVVPAL